MIMKCETSREIFLKLYINKFWIQRLKICNHITSDAEGEDHISKICWNLQPHHFISTLVQEDFQAPARKCCSKLCPLCDTCKYRQGYQSKKAYIQTQQGTGGYKNEWKEIMNAEFTRTIQSSRRKVWGMKSNTW